MSSIIIVLPKIEDAKKIKKILMQHGFDNIISCATGASALMEMNKQSGGLVISGYKLPDSITPSSQTCSRVFMKFF